MPFFSCTTQKTPHIAAFFETLPPDVETRHIQQYLQNTSAGPSYIAYSARGRKEGAMLVLKLLAFVPPFRYMYICINLSHSFMSLYIFQFFIYHTIIKLTRFHEPIVRKKSRKAMKRTKPTSVAVKLNRRTALAETFWVQTLEDKNLAKMPFVQRFALIVWISCLAISQVIWNTMYLSHVSMIFQVLYISKLPL